MKSLVSGHFTSTLLNVPRKFKLIRLWHSKRFFFSLKHNIIHLNCFNKKVSYAHINIRGSEILNHTSTCSANRQKHHEAVILVTQNHFKTVI